MASQMPFWLEKAIAWGQTDTPHTRNDISLHLKRLRDFLQQLLSEISSSSTTETLNRLPLLGQLLGRLCWNSHVTAEGASRGLLLQCLLALYSEHPSNAVERKANQWIQVETVKINSNINSNLHLLLFCLHSNITFFNISQTSHRCSCGSIWAVSEACVPLITCPEASPLIGALLQQQMTCIRESLSENFLDALHSAYSRYRKCFYCIFSFLIFAIELKFVPLFQTSASLKAFFPQSPPSLLIPLFTMPSGQCAHTSSLSLSALTPGKNAQNSPVGNHKVFEAWFLLVQCGYWVQMVVQLLVTSGPEDCGPLLWLLTFYHHPTNRWHHRASQLVRVFLISGPSLAPSLTLNLLVNFATFGQLPQSISAEITQKVSKLSSLKPLHSASHLSCYHKI
uniref:FA complementation group C n=1 Tax=Xiphophorus couchianus TaxID=32473 RepID=A0A3B5L3D8_9TELE